MVILSSPSEQVKQLNKAFITTKNFDISISHTTRKPRSDEIPNKDYYFIDNEEFRRQINNQEFLEYAKVLQLLWHNQNSSH